jgi:tight adherence protein B
MNTQVSGAIAAALAAGGGYLIYTSISFRWRGRAPSTVSSPLRSNSRNSWAARLAIGDVKLAEVLASTVLLAVIGGAGAYVLFGGVAPPIVAGMFAAATPLASYRRRHRDRLAASTAAWPALLEELRLRTGSLGRSVPQALFEAGKRAPAEWRDAFVAAEREWLLTTDFDRTARLLKELLSDPTADVVCETLTVAHEVGGSDLDRSLAELIEDRIVDVQGRKDAASRQAGVRFARRFVLLVPLGMAVAGLTIGTGRNAYATPGGQIAVAVGLLAVVVCWLWSGQLMRIPDEPRVFR